MWYRLVAKTALHTFASSPHGASVQEAQQPVPVLPEASSAAVQEASAAAEDAAEDDQEAGQASDDGPPEVRTGD